MIARPRSRPQRAGLLGPKVSGARIDRARRLLDEHPDVNVIGFADLVFIRTSPGNAGWPTVKVRRARRFRPRRRCKR